MLYRLVGAGRGQRPGDEVVGVVGRGDGRSEVAGRVAAAGLVQQPVQRGGVEVLLGAADGGLGVGVSEGLHAADELLVACPKVRAVVGRGRTLGLAGHAQGLVQCLLGVVQAIGLEVAPGAAQEPLRLSGSVALRRAAGARQQPLDQLQLLVEQAAAGVVGRGLQGARGQQAGQEHGQAAPGVHGFLREWHLRHSETGKATLPWHTPHCCPSRIPAMLIWLAPFCGTKMAG